MIIVADSSPLISFAIIEKLDILPKIFPEIYIPQAVYNELITWNKPYSDSLKVFAKSRIKQVRNKKEVEILKNELDSGEAEAIVLALENKITEILIDEHKGRNIAKSKGLFPIGTIGVLLKLKNDKHVDLIKPLLYKLMLNNIRISKSLYNKALELAGE